MNDVMIAQNIRKKYGKNTILHNASIHVKQGEIYGLVGKNGSGKTTFLRILTGLIQKYSGIVTLGKINNRQVKISTVINDPALFLNMSAFANMKNQAYLLGNCNSEQIKKVLRVVGLDEVNNKLVKHFSLGMTQRLKLAMALLENPDILILDEPLNGLDPDGIADLRALLRKLNCDNGITMLISSHILSELEQIATCFGIMHDGKIIEEIYTNELLQSGKTLEELYMACTKGDLRVKSSLK